MGLPSVGSVVLVSFPFSDLSRSKLRPVVVIAEVDHQDWILCQVTSNPYADPRAVELTTTDFSRGALRHISYARPGKLFTAHHTLIVSEVGILTDEAQRRVIEAVVDLLRDNLPP